MYREEPLAKRKLAHFFVSVHWSVFRRQIKKQGMSNLGQLLWHRVKTAEQKRSCKSSRYITQLWVEKCKECLNLLTEIPVFPVFPYKHQLKVSTSSNTYFSPMIIVFASSLPSMARPKHATDTQKLNSKLNSVCWTHSEKNAWLGKGNCASKRCHKKRKQSQFIKKKKRTILGLHGARKKDFSC